MATADSLNGGPVVVGMQVAGIEDYGTGNHFEHNLRIVCFVIFGIVFDVVDDQIIFTNAMTSTIERTNFECYLDPPITRCFGAHFRKRVWCPIWECLCP